MTTKPKTLRSDARRNHERLVASARELFASRGVDVSVEEITHHAGLGMGTLYRHFATKEELIDAVLEEAFAELVRLAEHAAAEADAWVGFTGFLEGALSLHARNRGVRDILATREHGAHRAHAMRARIRPLLRRLVERGEEHSQHQRREHGPERSPGRSTFFCHAHPSRRAVVRAICARVSGGAGSGVAAEERSPSSIKLR